MRRFYRTAEVEETDDGFGVALDGRPVRTPAGEPLVVPARGLAEAIAAEWDSQGDEIRPQEMRLTRLASTAIDRVRRERPAVIEQVAAYAGTDLVCYRADSPEALAHRQDTAWRPLIEWLEARFHARLAVTAGIMPRPQTEEALERLRGAVAALDDMTLSGLQLATTACGSLVLALALAERRIDAGEAWTLSLVDEFFQVEFWGEDPAAAARREDLRADIASAARFMELCRP